MEFKDLIRLRRQELGLTLDEVAKAVGVGKATVQRWESGNINNPRRDKIAALAQVLGISPMELVDAADMAASQVDDSDYIREISKALQHNPKLGLLFDRSRKMSESDLDVILGVAAAIQKERDPD